MVLFPDRIVTTFVSNPANVFQYLCPQQLHKSKFLKSFWSQVCYFSGSFSNELEKKNFNTGSLHIFMRTVFLTIGLYVFRVFGSLPRCNHCQRKHWRREQPSVNECHNRSSLQDFTTFSDLPIPELLRSAVGFELGIGKLGIFSEILHDEVCL